MATKKKNSSKKVSPKASVKVAAAAVVETPADKKQDAIYGCIVKIFHDVGLPHISTPDVKIIWSTLNDPANIVDQLGNGIRDCIIGKGFNCPGLAGLFQILHDTNKITTVGELVDIIEKVVS